MSFLDKSIPSNFNFLDFPLLAWSCPNSSCGFWNQESVFVKMLHYFVISLLKNKLYTWVLATKSFKIYKSSPYKGIEEWIEVGEGARVGMYPQYGGCPPRNFNNSLSVYLFLEFEPELSKSEEFNNLGVTEDRAFRILLITKNSTKSDRICLEFYWNRNTKCRGVLHSSISVFSLFLKAIYKVNSNT